MVLRLSTSTTAALAPWFCHELHFLGQHRDGIVERCRLCDRHRQTSGNCAAIPQGKEPLLRYHAKLFSTLEPNNSRSLSVRTHARLKATDCKKEQRSHCHVCPSSSKVAPVDPRHYLRSSPVDWALHTAHASSGLTSLRGARPHIVESTTRVLRPAGHVSSTANKDRFDTLSIPHYVIHKGSLRGRRCGTSYAQMLYHRAHEALRKARKKGFEPMLERFQLSEEYRESQEKHGWTEELYSNLDKIASEERRYCATREERARFQHRGLHSGRQNQG